MATSEQLRTMLDSATPRLQAALAVEAMLGVFRPELRLASTVCGMATAALRGYLLDVCATDTERVIRTPATAPREMNLRRMHHVMLVAETDDVGKVVIDPTWRQFFRYVGLTPARATQHEEYGGLYPQPSIALFPLNESDVFADGAALTAFEVARLVPPADVGQPRLLPPEGVMQSAGLNEITSVYRDIWDIAQAEAFPLEAQRTSFRASVDRIIYKMQEDHN